LRAALLILFCLGLAGCGGDEDLDHPTVVVVPPALAPPPAYSDRALSREAALAVASEADDPGDAIRTLDAHPLDFQLTPEVLTWFGEQGLDPAVLDYLRKRSKVDWSALRGDVDPETPR
jgi:hypothetical protein